MSDGSEEMGRLAADLATAGVRASARAGTAMGKALNDISAGAKNRAPVDTGNLRNSISVELQNRGGTIRGEVGPTARYGGFVENGTSRQRAQPYLRPATDAVLPGYEQALGQIGANVIGGR